MKSRFQIESLRLPSFALIITVTDSLLLQIDSILGSRAESLKFKYIPSVYGIVVILLAASQVQSSFNGSFPFSGQMFISVCQIIYSTVYTHQGFFKTLLLFVNLSQHFLCNMSWYLEFIPDCSLCLTLLTFVKGPHHNFLILISNWR